MDEENSTVFLIIDGYVIKDLTADNYRAYEKDLSVYLRMAAKNMVCEETALIWVVEMNAEDINTEDLKGLYNAMRGRKTHQLVFLASNGETELIKSEFFLTARAAPSLSSWTNPTPEWSNYAMTFEEVEPHD